MPKSITIFNPDGTESFSEGSGSVHKINVKFYFANVVQIVIFMDDSTKITYYQIPCIFNEPPPTP